jgi:hypothetical protein
MIGDIELDGGPMSALGHKQTGAEAIPKMSHRGGRRSRLRTFHFDPDLRQSPSQQGAWVSLRQFACGEIGGFRTITGSQPRGFVWQTSKQSLSSPSQLPTTSGTDGVVCWVPVVGGGGGGVRSFAHRSKLFWHVTAHDWAILFFGMGAKLPAKLVTTEQNRIIGAPTTFICTPPKLGH